MLIENQFIKQITSGFQNSDNQLNTVFESDCELIQYDERSILAVTIDSIVEEIDSGLYQDPFLTGWIAVVASLSDLAATGAQPIGLLLLQNIPSDYPDDQLEELQKGILAACEAHQTYILGGDTNMGRQLEIGTVALGKIDDNRSITRKGYSPGDQLFISDRMGTGGAFAFDQMANDGQYNFPFNPCARLKEGNLIRQLGTTCIDTSDGFFPALCNLLELNHGQVCLSCPLSSMVDNQALAFANSRGIPAWYFLAGPHGEFELLFTIPSKNTSSFRQKAARMGWDPICIGEVKKGDGFTFPYGDLSLTTNPFRIANGFTYSKGDIGKYLLELKKIEAEWQRCIKQKQPKDKPISKTT